MSTSYGGASRLERDASYSTESIAKHQSELGGDENILFAMVASVDARTLPLALLQSRSVYLVVGDVSKHCRDGTSSADHIIKMNSPCPDISFEQLVISLAQLQRMLVSVLTDFNSDQVGLVHLT